MYICQKMTKDCAKITNQISLYSNALWIPSTSYWKQIIGNNNLGKLLLKHPKKTGLIQVTGK